MSTVERPVTQIVETAVKSASAKDVRRPSAAAAGSDSSAVKIRMRARNTTTANLAGDVVVRVRTQSKASRPRIRRVRRGRAWPVRPAMRRPPRSEDVVMVLRPSPD